MATARVRIGPMICGYCQSGNCNYCPRGVRNGNGRVVPCGCPKPYCGGQVLRCLDCKNEGEGEISPDDWRCLDREACELAVQRRLDGNVHVQMVREVMKRVSENPGTETKPAAKKKEGNCIHCGESTGGGLFRPGHDAKYVAENVRKIVDDKATTLEDVLAEMKERGTTEALRDKLVGSVNLARTDRERRAKTAADKAKADAEKAAAAQAAKEARAAEKTTAQVAPVSPTPENAAEGDAPKSARKLAGTAKK